MKYNENLLFHDGTSDFCTVEKKEQTYEYTLTLRVVSEKADKVYIVIDGIELEMSYAYRDDKFEYYQIKIELQQNEMIKYSFKCELEDGFVTYDMAGGYSDLSGKLPFELTAGFETPDWAKGAIIYQIFTDRFCNGDTTNDVLSGEYAYIGRHSTKVEDWYEYPQETDVHRFYGGDIQGIWNKLDYLEKLGVEAIYLNPIFVSPSNHKYDIQDYHYVDPHYGKIVKDEGELLSKDDFDNKNASKYISRTTSIENLEASNKFFAEFVEEVHRRGMKVIIDGVFNHCGSFNRWMDREGFYKANGSYDSGAYEEKDSQYNSYFKFNSDKWPDNGDYEGWWGFDTLPKLNYEDSEKLCQEIIDIGVKWVSPPYNVDGWRLDVAADLGHGREFNHKFWKRFRSAVKKANKDAIILAEHYGSAKEWLHGDEWDTVMNYDAFMDPVSWFLTGVDKHSDKYEEFLKGNSEAFIGATMYHMADFQSESLLVAMNELSNHDHSRFMTRTNGIVGRTNTLGPEMAEKGVKKSVMKAAVVMQMTLPGAPTIYYGDEVGLCGWTDPDNRRTFPWGKEDFKLLEFHRDMIDIHKQNVALKRGAYRPLFWDDNILCYGRFLGGNKVVTLINNSEEDKMFEIPVWQLGVEHFKVFNRVMMTKEDLYNAGHVAYEISDGVIKVLAPALSSSIYVAE